MESYYFGCGNPREGGHFAFDTNGRKQHGHWLEKLDGRVQYKAAPGEPREPQGVCALSYTTDGTDTGLYTLVGFWDRTGDDRYASNSIFAIHGYLTFEQAVETAKILFPKIFQRFTFPLTLHPADA